MSQTDLEKENLEVHIELATLREAAINKYITDVLSKIEILNDSIEKLQQDMSNLTEERNNQIIRVGTWVIALLLGVIGALLMKVIIPMLLAKG